MATPPPHVCEHLEDFASQENGLKTFQLLHSVFVVSSSTEQRRAKILNAFCFDCSRRDLYLRLCMHCTYFGCSAHISAHCEKADHVFTMELQYGQLYCNKCVDYVFDTRLDKIARVNALSGDAVKRHVLELVWPRACKIDPPVELDEDDDEDEEMERVAFSKTNRLGLRGMLNLGSTCYMNSVIQAIAHTPILRDYFFTEQHRCQSVAVGHCLITKLFRDFYTGDRTPVVLNDFLYLLWIRADHLSGYKQQDAHEFFMAALEILHKHCGESSQCDCIVHKAFTSTIKTDVVCQKCAGVSTRIDPTWVYSLDLTPSTQSLEDCLRHLTATECLNSEIRCETCQSHQQSTKQDTIKTLPVVLCFHLKRFQQSLDVKQKLKVKINFPERLEMSPYLAKDEEVSDDFSMCKDEGNHYLLFAVIIHKGEELDAGHYISYIRYLDSVWYRCDDTIISEVDIDEVLQSEGYLLFYHKQRLEYH